MLKKISRKLKYSSGFTLPELMISCLIIMPILVGGIFTFIQCLELSELSGNMSTAILGTQTLISQIEDSAFNQIFSNYNNTTFSLSGLTGAGVTYVDNSDPDLLKITNTFCWRQKSGRVIGEDKNLNGQLNAGEDSNGNGILDSPVQLATLIYNE